MDGHFRKTNRGKKTARRRKSVGEIPGEETLLKEGTHLNFFLLPLIYFHNSPAMALVLLVGLNPLKAKSRQKG